MIVKETGYKIKFFDDKLNASQKDRDEYKEPSKIAINPLDKALFRDAMERLENGKACGPVFFAVSTFNTISKTKKIERAYPPLSVADTVKAHGGSIHGQAELFEDHEIILPILARAVEPPKIAKGVNGKAVIQQQATRGCTAACVAMLQADHGKAVDWDELMLCNLGDIDTMRWSLEASGLKVLTERIESFDQLQEQIRLNGPAIVSVNTGYGSHRIIVDSIAFDQFSAIIREPYHGWQITVTGKALKTALELPSTIIQILV